MARFDLLSRSTALGRVGIPISYAVDEDALVECRVIDTRLLNRYNFFVLKVLKAWTDLACKDPCTLHHRGRDVFMVAGESIKLLSKMR